MAGVLEITGLLQINTANLTFYVFYLDNCYTFIDGYKTAGLRQERTSIIQLFFAFFTIGKREEDLLIILLKRN